MTSGKWLIMFFSTVLLIAILLCGFNILTDPFGIFGDPIMDWYSYNITNNPRAAKIAYLDEHYSEYDSYIIGCSSTSSFPVDAFHEYLDAKFYNLIMYGADMLDVEQTVDYIIENYTVENIVLNVYIDNGVYYADEPNKYTHSMHPNVDGTSKLEYYGRYLFLNPEYGISKIKAYKEQTWLSQSYNIFDTETGAYDKRRRDVEPISSLEDYYKAYPVFADYPTASYAMPYTSECMESIANIVKACEDNGVNLIVVTAPVYADWLKYFSMDDVKNFYTSLAEVTDFWDFSYSSVSFEERYFYDSTHFRNNVGYMAAAKIFDDNSIYIPSDFGYYVTAENVNDYMIAYPYASAVSEENIATQVPIIMYHNITDDGEGDVAISEAEFEAHLKRLKDEGYTAVTFDMLYDCVTYGTVLPEKPVVITFDDGYLSNYERAYPLLRKYDMCATLFVIGYSLGQDTYKDTDYAITPHFNEAEMQEMVSSGIINIGSHTYDMHQAAEFEAGVARTTMAQLDGESEAEYIEAIRADVIHSKEQLGGIVGEDIRVLSFPQGYYNDNILAVLREEGVVMSVSTDWGVATVVKGLEQSLYAMKRIGADNMTADQLMAQISK
ncbi:MAG: polysaccharide deacetylase family protein [Clostridia bacterium]|nr:polysaccharide deacetylase family protein [Clostridia bacterium]